MTVDVEELLEHIEDFRHLGEDECAVTAGLEFTEKTIEPLELATVVLE